MRLRWDPPRAPLRFWVITAAAIWIFVKLPQEWWIHVAQLDFTDELALHPALGPTDPHPPGRRRGGVLVA